MSGRVYLDTTVLADALLKVSSGPGKDALRAISGSTEVILCQYAIKEFRSGAFSHFVWTYNKAVECSDWATFFAACARMAQTPRKNHTSTALEALSSASTTGKELNLESVRATLRLIILKAWRGRRKLATSIVGILDCYLEESELVQLNDKFELGRLACDAGKPCAAAAQLLVSGDAARLLSIVESQADKRENTTRSKALQEILKNRRPNAHQCRALGDAAIVSYAPSDATILTTNSKDLEPLARGLGKKCARPNSLVEEKEAGTGRE